MKTALKGLLPEEMRAFVASLGEPAFRARQLIEWLHGRAARSFAEMTNLPASLRARLADIADVDVLAVARVSRSARDGTAKYLFDCRGGGAVEAVLLPHDYGHSVCVSSQVGCRMGCRFCASTLFGLERNLSAAEMVDQVIQISRDLPAGERVRSLVVMGMGEPLENLDEVIRFLRLCNLEDGLGIGYRHMTVSTCGLVPGILALAGSGLPVTLAVSLHAPDDELRSELMPINRKYRLDDVLAACDRYAEITGRRVTFEYILIKGRNDGLEQARALGRRLRGRLAHVNLIPANPVSERGVERPDPAVVAAFQRALEGYGVTATVRRTMGDDIAAACGQLRLAERRATRAESGPGVAADIPLELELTLEN